MPIRGIGPLNSKVTRLQKALGRTVPVRIAADAEAWFKRSFVNQGFTDTGFKKWAATKNGKAGRILKGSGLLMNSVRAEVRGTTIRVSAGGAQIPYARIHNEGGTIEGTVNVREHTRRAHRTSRRAGKRRVQMTRMQGKVKAHTRKMLVYMAKRQYMGRSRLLEVKMRGTILSTINEAMR